MEVQLPCRQTGTYVDLPFQFLEQEFSRPRRRSTTLANLRFASEGLVASLATMSGQRPEALKCKLGLGAAGSCFGVQNHAAGFKLGNLSLSFVGGFSLGFGSAEALSLVTFHT